VLKDAIYRRLSSHDADRQRSRSILLLIFGVIRIGIWTVMAVLIGLGLLHVPGFDWSRVLAESLPFVVLISLYANWATDIDAATSAFAALVAADARQASEQAREMLERDFSQLETDIAHLAELDPGEEAEQLARAIRHRFSKAGSGVSSKS
jgi:hypothetical protein